jgi:hypothetical protein
VAQTRSPQRCDPKQRPPHYTIRSTCSVRSVRSVRSAPVPLFVSVTVPVVSVDFLGIHALLIYTITAADGGGQDRESEGVSMGNVRHVPASPGTTRGAHLRPSACGTVWTLYQRCAQRRMPAGGVLEQTPSRAPPARWSWPPLQVGRMEVPRRVPAQGASDGLREWMRTALRALRMGSPPLPGHTGGMEAWSEAPAQPRPDERAAGERRLTKQRR